MNTPEDLISPYQPPAADLSQPMGELPKLEPHERSAAPKVFGVLSIVFASIVLLFSTFGMLASAATGAADNMGSLSEGADQAADLNVIMHPMAKIYKGFGIQSMILFVMSALLLAIGIGQLRYRGWARRWSVYWGAAGLVCVGAMVAISLLIISPAYAELFGSAARMKDGSDLQQLGGLGGWLGGTFAVICVFVYAPYPAMMLLFFTRERVRASMRE